MSCSVEKRHYLPGYSVNWKKNNSSASIKKRSEKLQANETDQNNILAIEEKDIYPLSASKEDLLPALAETTIAPDLTETKDSCDIIELKNSSKIQAKVLEINPSTVKYKNCGDADGPDRIINKADIAGITYSNGSKESPDNLKDSNPKVEKQAPVVVYYEEPRPQEVEDHRLASHALATGICAYIPIFGWIFAIISIILGLIVIHAIDKEPKKYSGRKKALIGIGLGIGGLIAGALIVFIIFFSGLIF